VRAREGLASRSSASSSSSCSSSRASGKSAPELESRVATAHSDGTLRVWDPHKGRCLRELRPNDTAIAMTMAMSATRAVAGASSSFDSDAGESLEGGGHRRSSSGFANTHPSSSPQNNYQHQQQQSPSSSHRHRTSATAADYRSSSSSGGGSSSGNGSGSGGGSSSSALAATCVTWGPAPGSALVGYADGAVSCKDASRHRPRGAL